jgi:hypothetical protein
MGESNEIKKHQSFFYLDNQDKRHQSSINKED